MARKAGLYTFLRSQINYSEFPSDIPGTAANLLKEAHKEGYKTQLKYVQQFLYVERKREQVERASRGQRGVIPQQPGPEAEGLDVAVKTIDTAIGMLTRVKHILVKEAKFTSRIRTIILPALKEAGILT